MKPIVGAPVVSGKAPAASLKVSKLPVDDWTVWGDLRYEENRLKTFRNWDAHDKITPERLAKAGFYYSGTGDQVVCFSCKISIGDWGYHDRAIERHRQHSPGCDFVGGRSANVPYLGSSAGQVGVGVGSGHRGLVDRRPEWEVSCRTRVELPTTQDASRVVTEPIRNGHVVGEDLPVEDESPGSAGTGFSFDRMHSESERLRTFKSGWPVPFVRPEDLARAGFFYLQESDRVQCAFCYGIVSKWETGDDPLREHMRHFPMCPFLFGEAGRSNGTSGAETGKFRDGDVCGPFPAAWEEHAAPENGHRFIGNSRPHYELEDFGVSLHRGPQNPHQASLEARLRSFSTWPSSVPIKPQILAEAGFFYIGIGDQTKCFFCDGGLCHWEAGDDPWVEHARWFKNCAFVRLNKGDEFIRACLVETDPVRAAGSPVSNGGLTREHETGSNETTPTSSQEETKDLWSCLNIQLQKEDSKQEPEVPKTSQPVSEGKTESIPATKPRGNFDISLEEENRLLKEQRLCKICMDQDVAVVFLPCGHLLACPQCAPAMKDCPLCRKKIKGTVRTFLS